MTDAAQQEAGALKPCPFCGGPPEVRTTMGEYWVSCGGCEATTVLTSKRDKAIAAWNTRTPARSGGEVTREAVARAIGAVPVNMNIDIAGLISDGSPSADLNAVLGEAAERVLALIQAPLPGDLAELEALAKAAGSGGWRIGGSGYVVTGGKGADVKPVADFLANPEPDVFKAGPTLSEAMDRAKYVVAACNAAPGLISRIAALSADNARLREEREFKEIMDGADAAIALSTGKGGEE